MTILCLSDDLIDEYLKFKLNSNYNQEIVTKLLKFIQPALVSTCQHKLLQDPSAANQFTSDPIINLIQINASVELCPKHQLVNQTTLKLQLVTKKDKNVEFTQLNIKATSESFEQLNMLLAGIHPTKTNKKEAVSHIKSLLSDAVFVNITDKYIAKDTAHWNQCKSIIEEIIPHREIKLKIITDSFNKHKDLTSICASWNIKYNKIRNNVHDRYIETDKLIILISSGVFHLSTTSNTDLTYIVKVKH